MLIQPLRLHIIVFVHRIDEVYLFRRLLIIKLPGSVIPFRSDVRAYRTDQPHIRILFMDRLFKSFIAGEEIHLIRLPLLVADSHHRHAEGLWMAHLRAQSAPLRIHSAVCEFHQIQRILNELLEFRLIHLNQLIGLILAGKPHIQHGKRLRADQLAQLEIFIIAESQRLVVMGIAGMESVLRLRFMHCPAVEVASSALRSSHALLPAVTVFQCISLDDTAARETKEAGL